MNPIQSLLDFKTQLFANPSPWMGGIIGGMITGGVFGWISHVRNVRPVLIFDYKADGWHLQNVGWGPAITIVVSNADNDKRWQMPTYYPALGKGDSVKLKRISPAEYLAVKYTDLTSHWYSTECGYSLNQVRTHWRFSEPYKDWVPLRKLGELDAVDSGKMSLEELSRRILKRRASGRFEDAD